MLTYSGLHTEAAVVWSRCYSHQALQLQSREADPAESEPDAYRMSLRFSIFDNKQAG